MPELAEGLCGGQPELALGESQEACGEATVHHVNLRRRPDSGAERCSPGLQLVDEEDGFQQLGVVLGGRLLHADCGCGLCDVEHLAGLACELTQQERQLSTLPDTCEFHHVAVNYEVDVVIEPACAGFGPGAS